MRSRLFHLVILIVLCLSFTFTGCGGSGGGSSGSNDGGGSSGLSYTGETAQADIGENNATEIAAGAFGAGQTGAVISSSEVSQDSQGESNLGIDNLRTVKLPQILGDAVRFIDFSPPLYKASSNVETESTISDTEVGPCGGSVSYTLTVNDATGEFEGTFTFSNYCDFGVIINGDVDAEGQADLDSGDIITVTFSFDNLSDQHMRMDGEMSMDFSGSPILCTIDCLLKDKSTSKVYWAETYEVDIYEYAAHIEFEIVGKFYHPDYGYVDVSTEVIFVLHDGDDWPSSGILLMVGANNTKARLTAIDNLRCRVEADTDGDGDYDWDSSPLLWSDYLPFDEFQISDSYLQYRTYSDAAENRYHGYISFLKNGQPIEASDIADIVLKDENQNEISTTISDLYILNYYFGGWNAADQQVYYSGPYDESGYGVYLPDTTLLNSGNYTYEATTSRGVKLSETQYFPGNLELEAVDSSTMVDEWINGDLKLTWSIPDPVEPFDQVRVRLQSGEQVYLIIRLPNTAIEVTIPQQWIDNVKQLSKTSTMDWCVLLYDYDSTTGNQYARSQSDRKPITGWYIQSQVSAGDGHTVGLISDGTVLAVGNNADGQCNVSGWTNIVQVSAGRGHTVGLKSDGTVVAVGNNDYGQCNVGAWTDIKQVAAGADHTVGLKSDGTVVAMGSNLLGQCNVGTWTDIDQVAAWYHTVGLKSDDTVIAVGDNEYGQCNVGAWTDIGQVAAGGNHTLGLKSNGTVVAVGINESGQGEVGGWTDIIQVAASYLQSVGAKSNFTAVAAGCLDPDETGQCDVDTWTDVKQVAAGAYHTVGLKSDGTLIAAGCSKPFGDYGQCDVSGWDLEP